MAISNPSPQVPQMTGDMPDDPRAEQLRSLAHDLRNSLHVISTGLTLLKASRADEHKFAEVSTWLEVEQRKAATLFDEFYHAANGRAPSAD